MSIVAECSTFANKRYIIVLQQAKIQQSSSSCRPPPTPDASSTAPFSTRKLLEIWMMWASPSSPACVEPTAAHLYCSLPMAIRMGEFILDNFISSFCTAPIGIAHQIIDCLNYCIVITTVNPQLYNLPRKLLGQRWSELHHSQLCQLNPKLCQW